MYLARTCRNKSIQISIGFSPGMSKKLYSMYLSKIRSQNAKSRVWRPL